MRNSLQALAAGCLGWMAQAARQAQMIQSQSLTTPGGRAPRAKGNRLERAIVRLLQDAGLAAERVPLSGQVGGSYKGDLTVPVIGRSLVVEAKARANGFSQIYSWLDGRDVLIVKADRRDALVVLPLRLAVEIVTPQRSPR
jgi:hypothetical protein